MNASHYVILGSLGNHQRGDVVPAEELGSQANIGRLAALGSIRPAEAKEARRYAVDLDTPAKPLPGDKPGQLNAWLPADPPTTAAIHQRDGEISRLRQEVERLEGELAVARKDREAAFLEGELKATRAALQAES
ncbi:MAG: hypothetical protein JNM56_12900 [Planctomycetia bacterium]|nr:hypothetical protein [Planctomycetia bacterium]